MSVTRPSLPHDQGLSPNSVKRMRAALLNWYDQQGRELPWRIRPEDRAAGIIPDPYAIWLSEIMCQQTTITHAAPYWQRFLEKYPTICDLARADRDEVLGLWAGLGYYARARNLHDCAKIICHQHKGRFPRDEAGLRKLPGIGAYSSASIAAICYDEPTNIIDSNVERVISRIFTIKTPLPKSKTEIRDRAGQLICDDRCGDYGQALMDLGSVLCMARKADCARCPWQEFCGAYAQGEPLIYPKKMPKKTRPIRYGAVFVLRYQQYLLLERRKNRGILGGMMGFIGSPWDVISTDLVSGDLASGNLVLGDAKPSNCDDAPDKMQASPSHQEPTHHSAEYYMHYAPAALNWQKMPQSVRHIFTHFELKLDVYSGVIGDKACLGPQYLGDDYIWVPIKDIGDYVLPSLFKKVLNSAAIAQGAEVEK